MQTFQCLKCGACRAFKACKFGCFGSERNVIEIDETPLCLTELYVVRDVRQAFLDANKPTNERPPRRPVLKATNPKKPPRKKGKP